LKVEVEGLKNRTNSDSYSSGILCLQTTFC
jgi:hypothetical protein